MFRIVLSHKSTLHAGSADIGGSSFIRNRTRAAVLWGICCWSVIWNWSGPSQSAFWEGHKKKFTLIFKSRWKENIDSLRLSTGIIYAVQEPLSRPKLDIFDKHLKWNSIRKVRTCVTHGTLFWRKKWPIVLHIWCVSDMSIRLYTICS